MAKISAKEKARRKRLSEKRKRGYNRWLKKKRKEIADREEKKRKEKEKLRKKRLKEAEEKKNKRRVGRPKKRGRKKKRIRKKVIKQPSLPKKKSAEYKIISCYNKKQNKYIGYYTSIEEAYCVFNTLKEESEKIVFPKKINVSNVKKDAIYEYLLLEKNIDGTKENIYDRNEYGILISQQTNKEEWVIRDKFQYNVEETFWVWGFNPRTERKDFLWIYKNIILNNINSKYDIKRIILYKNKIMIKNDNGIYDIVICKTIEDSVRFYNLLRNYAIQDKIKQIYFMGSYSEYSDKRKKLEDEIISQTGWSKKKLGMSSTKYFLKKEK